MNEQHLKLDRLAFLALRKLKPEDTDALRNASLGLGHLLRTHGLSATVGYSLQAGDASSRVAEAFMDALDQACPIKGSDAAAKARALKEEDESLYLLHSRLALALANGMALAARALWPTVSNLPAHQKP